MTQEVKLFTNFSEEEFIGVWNKKPYPFKPSASQPLPGYLAEHFAKHLIDREINKRINKGEKTDSGHELMTNNKVEREKYMNKCVTNLGDEVEDETEMEVNVLKHKFKKSSKKKDEKKEEPKTKKEVKKEEKEFEELNEK